VCPIKGNEFRIKIDNSSSDKRGEKKKKEERERGKTAQLRKKKEGKIRAASTAAF